MTRHDEAQLTPWFTGQQQPVQPGVYQRLNSLHEPVYSLWNGAQWLWSERTPARAATHPDHEPSLVQHLPWRGLLQPPMGGYGPARPARPADTDDLTPNPTESTPC
jgi:hypothetical protein